MSCSAQYSRLTFKTINKNPQRRLSFKNSMDERIYTSPKRFEELPRSEPILPGHTLIRPAIGMLKSSIKFPQKDLNTLVYGNTDNLGITYGKTNERILYSDFRKSNELLKALIKYIKHGNNGNESSNRNGVMRYTVLALPLQRNKRMETNADRSNQKEVSENEVSTEILDTDSSELSNERVLTPRRIFSNGASGEDSLSVEKNAGNPYTVHGSHYKQNWMWDHVMSGDHMNINPYAPVYGNYGPSGAALLFGRKWWYFNQDDYKPM